MRREANAILCYVTDRRALSAQVAGTGISGGEGAGPPKENDLLPIIRSAVAAGVDWVQLREKDMPTRKLLELARAAVAVAGRVPQPVTRILINDRLDIALASGAGGVHLGRQSLPVQAVAHWRRAGHAPAGFLVGASCHSLGEAVEAETSGADYIFFGPIFSTPAKAAFGPPQGVDKLAEVCQGVRIPVLAIGGVTLQNAPACLAAGAAGIAAIRLFQESSQELAEVVASLRSAG